MIYSYLMFSWKVCRVLAEFRAWSGEFHMRVAEPEPPLTYKSSEQKYVQASTCAGQLCYVHQHMSKPGLSLVPTSGCVGYAGNACPKVGHDSEGNRWKTWCCHCHAKQQIYSVWHFLWLDSNSFCPLQQSKGNSSNPPCYYSQPYSKIRKDFLDLSANKLASVSVSLLESFLPFRPFLCAGGIGFCIQRARPWVEHQEWKNGFSWSGHSNPMTCLTPSSPWLLKGS